MLYKPAALHTLIALPGDLQAAGAHYSLPPQQCLQCGQEMLGYLLDNSLLGTTRCSACARVGWVALAGGDGYSVHSYACMCMAMVQHMNRCSTCVYV